MGDVRCPCLFSGGESMTGGVFCHFPTATERWDMPCPCWFDDCKWRAPTFRCMGFPYRQQGKTWAKPWQLTSGSPQPARRLWQRGQPLGKAWKRHSWSLRGLNHSQALISRCILPPGSAEPHGGCKSAAGGLGIGDIWQTRKSWRANPGATTYQNHPLKWDLYNYDDYDDLSLASSFPWVWHQSGEDLERHLGELKDEMPQSALGELQSLTQSHQDHKVKPFWSNRKLSPKY